jgi:hypothetical protein
MEQVVPLGGDVGFLDIVLHEHVQNSIVIWPLQLSSTIRSLVFIDFEQIGLYFMQKRIDVIVCKRSDFETVDFARIVPLLAYCKDASVFYWSGSISGFAKDLA